MPSQQFPLAIYRTCHIEGPNLLTPINSGIKIAGFKHWGSKLHNRDRPGTKSAIKPRIKPKLKTSCLKQ